MEPIDLLISARWIVPIEPAATVLEHHAIAIRQGKILAILPAVEAAHRYQPALRVERPTHAILPGFVNAHAHAGMTLLRGAAEGLNFDAWLRERIWPLEARWLDPEFVRDGVALGIASMVASGVTCFAEQYLYPDVVAQTASNLQMRVNVGLPVIDLPTAWAGSADEYLDKGLGVHDAYRDDPLVSTSFAPHSPYTVSDAMLERIRRAADEIELPIGMHLHESAAELQDGRPIAKLERMGLLTPLFSAVHMTQADESDMEIAARTGINVVHCAQSNLKLGNGVCPVAKLSARGVNVALGTDGAASANSLDMLDELRTAALLAGPTLTAHQWLRMATLNGARSLNLADSIGSIEPGKWADLTCFDLHTVSTQPVRDVATAIVYSASRANVSDVWVAGRPLLTEGQFSRFDLSGLLSRANEWQLRISSAS